MARCAVLVHRFHNDNCGAVLLSHVLNAWYRAERRKGLTGILSVLQCLPYRGSSDVRFTQAKEIDGPSAIA